MKAAEDLLSRPAVVRCEPVNSRAKKFEVFLEGTNVCLMIEGDPPNRRYGFYTTRWLEASDENAASETALRMVKLELDERKASGQEARDLPRIWVSEIFEVDTFKEIVAPGQGFTFFPVDDN